MPAPTITVIINKVLSAVRTYVTDGETRLKLADSKATISGASPQTLLAAAGSGLYYRIHTLVLSTDSSGLITVSDGIGTYYSGNYTPVVVNFKNGIKQDTANTAITITHSSGNNVTGICTYKTEE